MGEVDRFIRLPTNLLERLLRMRLNGTQWSVLFWVVRRTIGWNRDMAMFSWYVVARDISMDRAGVLRAGRRLLGANILLSCGNRIGLQKDHALWGRMTDNSQDRLTGIIGDGDHRPMMTSVTQRDDACHRERRDESTDLRRPKDSSRDSPKKYKDRQSHRRRDLPNRGDQNEGEHSATAARPIPGKYDSVS